MLSYNAPHAKALSETMRSYWSQDEEQLHGLHPEGLCDFFIRLRLSCFLRLSDLGVDASLVNTQTLERADLNDQITSEISRRPVGHREPAKT